ncbi:MAG TPA: DUF4124 domain-containing protein [Cellvibrionaceae bacterium]
MKTLLFVLAIGLLFIGSIGIAEVYKTTDKYGNVIYTDQPPKSKSDETTEKVQVRPTNTMPAGNTMPPERRQQAPSADDDQPEYNVTIVSPTHEHTVPPGQRDLIIAVATDHPLSRGAQFAFYMNGELLGRETINNYSIREIIRGAHTLYVEVQDTEGNTLSTSDTITVFVRRVSVLN